MLLTIIALLIFSALLLVLFIWIQCYITIDEKGDNIIYVSRDEDFNWMVTRFLPVHALVYEHMCESLNDTGLALLGVLLTILLFPPTFIMGIIGLVAYCIKRAWRCFCNIFKRTNI
jgi:hypothetical protein